MTSARSVVPYQSRWQQNANAVKDMAYTVATDKDAPPLLLKLLRIKTPHGQEGELIHLFPKKGRKTDAVGNLIYFVGATEKHGTMFSSHMDTVHRTAGTIRVLAEEDKAGKPTNMLYGALEPTPTAKESGAFSRSVLGADDKTGCYLMIEMMKAKVPGVYVFHVGEERGGVGSRHMAKYPPDWMKKIKRCIAFDRKGYTSVITHQVGDRCCSEAFAKALSKALNEQMNLPKSKFSPDPTGLFTDSANYTNCIAECTNLSVGYFAQHTDYEKQDVYWLTTMLLPALLNVDWSSLPTVRKAGESTRRAWGNIGNKDTKEADKNDKLPEFHNKHNKALPWSGVNLSTDFSKIPAWSPDDPIPNVATNTALLAAIIKSIVYDGLEGFGEKVVKLAREHEKLSKTLEGVRTEAAHNVKRLDAAINENFEMYDLLDTVADHYGVKLSDLVDLHENFGDGSIDDRAAIEGEKK